MLFDLFESGFAPDQMRLFLSYLLALAVAITVHEAAHAYSAHWLGDETPKREGRLSLNPLDHLDPIGSVAILIAGFGWGKPVPVNPLAFRDKRRDFMLTAAAGPFSNLVLAGVGIGLYHLTLFAVSHGIRMSFETAQTLLTLWTVFVSLNLALMVFNLLPVGPLDGAKVIQWFLPERMAERFYRNATLYGGMLLFALILIMHSIPIVGRIVFWPVEQIMRITM